MVITYVRGLITPLIITHEPPSTLNKYPLFPTMRPLRKGTWGLGFRVQVLVCRVWGRGFREKFRVFGF